MQPTWIRGVTRVYIVLWALWLAILLVRLAALPPILWKINPCTILGASAIAGIVIPALLLLGLRWVLAGFSPNAGK